MNIGINASYLEYSRAGVARFIVNVLKNWAISFPEHNYYLYFRRFIPEDDFLDNKCFIKKLIKCPSFLNRNSIWENFFLTNVISKEKSLDIFFSPSYTLPIWLNCRRKIVYIFDISYIFHSEWYAPKTRYYYKISTFFTVRNANLIVTCSGFSKQEIISNLKIDEEKIRVVHLAADDRFRPSFDKEKIEKIKKDFTSGRDYILFLGLIMQRRNIRTLLKAFKENIAKGQFNYCLLLIGANRTYPYIDINKLIFELGLEKDVFWHLYIDDSYLPVLYNGARLFIYPSYYEGFGIPLLEAMASGVPVITSNLSSLPEVVGNAAYFLKDPGNVDEVAEAIRRVSDDEKLRKTMIAEGHSQAKLFSWQGCARKMMQIFEEDL